MRKMRRNLLSPLALLIALMALALVAGTGASRNTASAAVQPTPPNPTPPPARLGMPAIHPTLQGIPAFTVADVQQFLNEGPEPATPFVGGPTVSGKRPIVTKIVFITSKEASALAKGTDVGLPDSVLVCYVGLQGPFSNRGLTGPTGKKLPALPNGFMIFDAQTGNLLVEGMRP